MREHASGSGFELDEDFEPAAALGASPGRALPSDVLPPFQPALSPRGGCRPSHRRPDSSSHLAALSPECSWSQSDL